MDNPIVLFTFVYLHNQFHVLALLTKHTAEMAQADKHP